MSTDSTTLPRPNTAPNDRAFWDRWKRSEVVEVNASTLLDSPIVPACYRGRIAMDAPNASEGTLRIALVARWKDAFVGGAILDVRDRTSVVRMLHVDAAWRRRGIGRRLLHGLFRRARLQFVQEVLVAATATDAGFFALHGFRPLEASQTSRDVPEPWISAALPASDPDGTMHTLLRRRLTTGFVSVPYDGITMKI